jgi:hypothetical protein
MICPFTTIGNTALDGNGARQGQDAKTGAAA